MSPIHSATTGKDRTLRKLITPEGVALGLHLADAGERAAAFLIDLVFVVVALGLFLSLVMMAGPPDAWMQAIVMVFVFAVTNFYFMFFEMRWQGASPGKRLLGLRVIDAKGGPLTADAIIARNLMRQIELWVPMAALFAPEQLFGSGPGWVQVGVSVWLFLMAAMPVFNRDRLRVGDMVAGTMVVFRPKAMLLPDVGGTQVVSTATPGRRFGFSDEQLAIYGIYELQVLEGLLRKPDGLDRVQSMTAVADRVKTKIHWPKDDWYVDPELFLSEFYVALRAHLEKNMLFGKRVTDKFSAQRRK